MKKEKQNMKIQQGIIPEFISGSSTHAVTQGTTKQQTWKTLKLINNETPYKDLTGRCLAVKAAVQGLTYFRHLHTPSSVLTGHLPPQGGSSLCITLSMRESMAGGRVRGIIPHGFTLIELLVVILIIGILAAVALPQYQQAVFRTKFNKVWSIAQQLRQMEELYYLENGTYKDNLHDSYVDFSKTCTGSAASFVCEGGFALDINAGSITLWYGPLITPGMDQSQTFRAMNKTLDQSFTVCQYFAHHTDYPNQVRCCSPNNTNVANCKKVLSKSAIPYTE